MEAPSQDNLKTPIIAPMKKQEVIETKKNDTIIDTKVDSIRFIPIGNRNLLKDKEMVIKSRKLKRNNGTK